MRTISVLPFLFFATAAVAQDIRVIDGETFEIEGEVIRLWGIDVPEPGQTCRLDQEVVYPSEFSTDLLAELLVELEYCDALEILSDGTTIARCHTADDENFGRSEINSMMVLLGGAWDQKETSGGQYELSQMVAEIRGYGVWGMGCAPPQS